jgi:hypothetical protein
MGFMLLQGLSRHYAMALRRVASHAFRALAGANERFRTRHAGQGVQNGTVGRPAAGGERHRRASHAKKSSAENTGFPSS